MQQYERVQAALGSECGAAALGVADTEAQHWMVCTCGIHNRLITIKAAQSNPKALWCRVCATDLSSPAMGMAEELDRFFQPQHMYAYEARVLRGTYGPFDFYLPAQRLAIEADGEQHFTGKIFGASCEEVRARDYRKMCAAFAAGIRMVRVPY